MYGYMKAQGGIWGRGDKKGKMKSSTRISAGKCFTGGQIVIKNAKVPAGSTIAAVMISTICIHLPHSHLYIHNNIVIPSEPLRHFRPAINTLTAAFVYLTCRPTDFPSHALYGCLHGCFYFTSSSRSFVLRACDL